MHFGWSQWLEIFEASCHFCEAQVGWSWLQSLASWSSFWLCRVGGITLLQATKARKDDSFLSEASELRQDPRHTSHLSCRSRYCLGSTSSKWRLLTSRSLHQSAGIASHALVTIMFKDVPLLFWLIPFCRILINSRNYLGKRQETSGISRILLNSHLKFLPMQSNSNVVQTNNQNVGEAQI